MDWVDRHVGSSKDWRAKWSLEAPPGPTTLAQQGAWPDSNVQALLLQVGDEESRNRMHRLKALFDREIVWNAHYAGSWGDRNIMEQHCVALESIPGKPFGSRLQEKLHFAWACDNEPVPQALLLHLARKVDGNLTCVHEDLLHRISPTDREWCESCLPPSSANTEEKESAYKEIQRHLLQNSERAFNRTARVPCLTHNKCCPAVPWARAPEAVDEEATSKKARLTLATSVTDERFRWEEQGRRQPLLVVTAGGLSPACPDLTCPPCPHHANLCVACIHVLCACAAFTLLCRARFHAQPMALTLSHMSCP